LQDENRTSYKLALFSRAPESLEKFFQESNWVAHTKTDVFLDTGYQEWDEWVVAFV
jgi:hypothetical protein